jgi:hypothetical protein
MPNPPPAPNSESARPPGGRSVHAYPRAVPTGPAAIPTYPRAGTYLRGQRMAGFAARGSGRKVALHGKALRGAAQHKYML